MFKLLKSNWVTGILAFSLAGAVDVKAIPFVDSDVINVKLDNANPSYFGSFNLLGAGYNPQTHHITSATALFGFDDDLTPVRDPQDPQGYSEVVLVDLALGGMHLGPVEVNFSTILGGPVLGSVLFDLSKDGILNYHIKKVSGDFYVSFARLDAEAAVPDGGATAVLLGLGMLGLSAVSRKFRKS